MLTSSGVRLVTMYDCVPPVLPKTGDWGACPSEDDQATAVVATCGSPTTV